MFFTEQDFKKIKAWLDTQSVKDSALPEGSIPFTGSETITMIQDGKSVKLNLIDALNSLMPFRSSDFINVSELDAFKDKYTLEEAINAILPVNRKLGVTITFNNKENNTWVIYQFKGKSLAEWYEITSWQEVLDYNKFKGLFTTEKLLFAVYPGPKEGDYAYVGSNLGDALVYRCNSKGIWVKSTETAKDFIEVTLGGNITVGDNGNWYQDGKDTGIKAEGPKGERGLTPLFKVIDNQVQYSYDNKVWRILFPISDATPVINAGTTTTIPAGNKAKVTRVLNGKDATFNFEIPQGDVGNGLKILGHYNTLEELNNAKLATAKAGDAYLVGADKPYNTYILVNGVFKDCGPITNANSYVRVVQELGDSGTDVISQKTITDEIKYLKTYKLKFEYGGLYVNGDLAYNKIRLRNKPLFIVANKNSIIRFKLHIPQNFKVVTNDDGSVYTWGYNIAGTLKKEIKPSIVQDTIELLYDGTYDYILFTIKKDDNSEISNKDLNSCYLQNITTPYDIENINSKVNENIFSKTDFEFGSFNSNTGALVENKIRLRTKPIYANSSKNKKLNIHVEKPNDLLYVTDPEGVFAYCYKSDGVPVKTIWLNIDTPNDLSIDYDGTYDYLRFTLKKENSPEITNEEKNKCHVFIERNIQNQIDSINSKLDGSLKGLKYVALGDSITYGFIPRNSDGYEGDSANKQLKSYAKLTAERLNLNFINYGITGDKVTNMATRCINMIDDADIITFMGGTNDVDETPIGTFNDRTTSTFYGALHVLMQTLYTKYIIGSDINVGRKKKIIIMTPIKAMFQDKANLPNTIGDNAKALSIEVEPYVKAIKEVASYYSFPVLDMYNLSGINPHLNRTWEGRPNGRPGHFNPYITDGVHPTQEGAEMMADKLESYIKYIIKK